MFFSEYLPRRIHGTNTSCQLSRLCHI